MMMILMAMLVMVVMALVMIVIVIIVFARLITFTSAAQVSTSANITSLTPPSSAADPGRTPTTCG